MRVRNAVFGLVASTALVGAVSAASAGTLTVTSAIQPLTTTNFTVALPIAKYNGAAPLLSVLITITGNVSGSAKIENLDSSDADVSAQVGATLSLRRPDGSTLVVAAPAVNSDLTLSAYDGTTDYAGPSGTVFSGSNTVSNSLSTSNAAILALFTGPGTVATTLRGVGASSANGGGNLNVLTATQAGGQATVTYTFADAVVPEPASWAMMVAGFGLMGVAMRRKRTSVAFSA